MAMIPNKNEMPSQSPTERGKNFKEVTYGYTAELALNEAKRCLNCKTGLAYRAVPLMFKFPTLSQ